MTEVNVLLNKLNSTIDQKIKEQETKEKNEQQQRKDYIKQIKKMSERIDNMLTLVNTLYTRRIPNTEYIHQLYRDFNNILKEQKCPIIFTNDKKSGDTPFLYVSLSFLDSYTNCRLSVSPNDIKYFMVWDRATDITEEPLEKLKCAKFLEFIVEFERAEKLLKDFIINL